MKVSIAWVFDHINADYHTVDIPALIEKLNQTTAEIEGYQLIDISLDSMTLVTIQSTNNHINAYSPEWMRNIILPHRDEVYEGQWYLIVQEETYRWATSTDLGGQRSMLLPSLHIAKEDQAGRWKKSFATKDCVFEVDNKSINHRPDLWGHRGFAREIAAILNLSLKPLDDFCADIPIKEHDQMPASKEFPFTISIENQQLFRRFAGIYIPSIVYTPSLLWMVARLSRVDAKALNAIVDCTNYVMFDISQPMHAFDAQRLSHQAIFARRARNKETLTLLDGQLIELTSQDIVIADANRPVALAGIMGGKQSSVHFDTKALFIEAANFDASTVRRSSQYHKLRTEGSARFEKNLDPNQNVLALKRFIQLLQKDDIAHKHSSYIASLGNRISSPVITVSHHYIENKLGVSIAAHFVKSTLEKIDFQVKEKSDQSSIIYHVTVPTFRATKDIAIKEDIVEEVGRFYGYSNIVPRLPMRQTIPASLHIVTQRSAIKHLLAFGFSMREISTYAFFDESFLQVLAWDPGKTGQVKDPVSANWSRLITTLMPNMFKAVAENYNEYDDLRFFEWGRCWDQEQDIVEKQKLTGIFYSKHAELNFYDIKAYVQQLFVQLGMPVQWQSINQIPYPWFVQEQTAYLYHENKYLGIAGMLNGDFIKQFAQGSAFVFELDAQALVTYEKPVKKFQPLSKYPAVGRDISMIAALTISVRQLTDIIAQIDESIRSVMLIDMFQKKDWKQERALTFRYIMQHDDRTMTKDEIDSISAQIIKAVQHIGATVR